VITGTPRLTALCIALCAFFGVGVASASASTVFVSTEPAVVGGKSCAQPKFNSIQAAIESGPSTVEICSGTYTEQLEISKAVKLTAFAGAGSATVAMPANPVNSASPCDTLEGIEQKDEISICASGTVTITGLNVEALPPLETCATELNGIFVAGGGTLKATNVAVKGAGSSLTEYKGCQHGLAIEVGDVFPTEIGHATLSKVTVSDYEKNGPTVLGVGSTLTMSASTVTGEGPSPYIAQNGIEVAFGGKATIKSTTISGNECAEVGVCETAELEEQASGVLFYQAAAGSALKTSKIAENDLGVYYSSGSATVPSSPDVSLITDTLTANRYEGVLLEEGKASLRTLTIAGSGRVGIDLYQVEGQESASESSARSTKISGQTEAAIKVTSDKEPGDIPGKFTFSGGSLTGNKAFVIDENEEKFEIIF
jgi:hypothetical protein